MASLDGQTAGLVPPPRKARVTIIKKEARERNKCSACEAPIPFRRPERWADPFEGRMSADRDEPQCLECFKILASTKGTTTEALAKLERIREAGMLVIMQSGSFGDAKGTVSVDFGDVFKVTRVGLIAPATSPDYKKSMEAITVDINVGGAVLTLWPHEVAPMPWVTLMQLQADGDYEMAYVSTDDQEGHYTLTAKGKGLVEKAFGKR